MTATDERRHCLLELLIENGGAAAVELERIDVMLAGERAPFDALSGARLEQAMSSVEDPARIAAGSLVVAFLDIALPADLRIPPQLGLLVVARAEDGAVQQATAHVDVVPEQPSRLGPPLRGGGLVALNGCCDGSHRRALLPIDGQPRLAQRFAIDFLRIEGEGSFDGPANDNASYFVHGAEVLAARGGEIVDLRDGMSENVPTAPLPAFNPDSAPGNFVVQRFDDGRFALYAHLSPGSLAVAVGDRVDRGQILARVGNTGNSSEPHLHFQVMDGPSPLGSDGVPYTFDRFELEARVDLTASELRLIAAPEPRRREGRLPMFGDVIAFTEGS